MSRGRILVIDNYDSFTWNLVHYLQELDAEVEVVRNDAMSVGQALSSGADAFLISPGPCTPDRAGISLDLVAACAQARRPLLGVCLGHQAIGQHFGGRVERGGLMHGKTSPILHDGSGLFERLPSPFVATRYHSLIVNDVPDALIVNARARGRHGNGLPSPRPAHPRPSSSIRRASPPSTAMRCSPISCGWRASRWPSRHDYPRPPSRPRHAAVARERRAGVRRHARRPCRRRRDRRLPGRADRARRDQHRDRRGGAARAAPAGCCRSTRRPGAIDVCGTGGDGHHTLNVSTAVALVVAACGVPVAKHGNRAASSKAGAADTLEALGLDLGVAGATAEASLRDLGICFLFAANHHPVMRRITPIRQRIGRRTIFNLMGPLANPAGTTRQLIGIARPDYVATYAEALAQLGTEAALVVSGEEGLDELSSAGASIAISVGALALAASITPADAGLPTHPLSAIRGGDPAHNAAALRRLLAGETGAYRDAVLLNAAAALAVAGRMDKLTDGAALAADAIDAGRAAALLDAWIAYR